MAPTIRISSQRLKSISIYASIALFAILSPVVLNLRVLSPFVDAQHKASQMLEFFGLSGFLAVLFVAAWSLRQSRPSDLAGYLQILLPALVALVWLNVLTERTVKDWDYICYEGAAQFLLAGKDAYQASPDCYYYPPLPILVFSWLYTAIQYAATTLRGLPAQSDKAWMLIFYLYQCAQWFLVVLAYLLTNRLAEKYGLQKTLALGAVTLLFILDNPLLRTLHFFQVNLWVLNVVLLVLLYSATHPFVAGLAAALGAHIKLYPAAFAAPWSLLKNKKALTGFAVGTVALFLLITASLGSTSIWRQFIANDPSRAGGFSFRDNSLHSLVYNSLRLIHLIQAEDLNTRIPEMLTGFLVFVALFWFLARAMLRYRIIKRYEGSDPVSLFERDGLLIDVVGLMLLASPVAWEHHYVLAIPLLLWTLALQIREGQLPIASLWAFLFIFALPTFDIFPLSYLRLSGLLILLIKSDPIHYLGSSREVQIAKPAGL